MNKVLTYIALISFTSFSSCTLYTDNETILDKNNQKEEIDVNESTIEFKKQNYTLTDSNNLNKATNKLENETKKIESEISTLLEAF